MGAGDDDTLQRSKLLGARHVATWMPGDGGWQLARLAPGRGKDRLMTAAEYVAALPNRRRDGLTGPFLDCTGTMAVFELRRDSVRHALGVKVIPFRTTPTLHPEVLTEGVERHTFNAAHPVLARKEGFSRYGWDTPRYREICAEMGLDPDEGRPRYRAAYAGIAGELERWVGEVFTNGVDLRSPAGEAKRAAFDLLDLMRADRPCDPSLLDALRRYWVRVDPGRMPRYGELDWLIETEALLHGGGEWRPAGMPFASVDFLPSRYGSGYSASIYGFYGQHEADGWVPADYGRLRGIAIEPDAEALHAQTWLRVAVRRLRGQGVLFLTRAEARAYLASDEAAYWVWQEGGTMKWRHDVRAPSHAERLRWRVLPPELPLDRELMLRAGRA